ncbi:hypothetical protein M977_01574 [Buttiauxella gaviniae ATCC 51604]|uniref:Uncharacterized protein n=1 Tax=Buttiauxella gaviniae ATCC 51604 TaxID=1354253 RepID=A0A1B7I2B2_9ENTR|nr:hypothetical protein M977_01574 [Buttiauxella gaviniae ATCC 51604]
MVRTHPWWFWRKLCMPRISFMAGSKQWKSADYINYHGEG